MMEQLYVYMFGNFSLKYKGQLLTLERNSATKAMQLLQILLYYGKSGITRSQLLHYLYDREELENPANNLRVTVHRIRKKLLDAGLPEWDYIRTENGSYYFSAPMEVVLDVAEFDELLEQAEECENEAEKVVLRQKACKIYRGDLLSNLNGEEWVLMEGLDYQEKYASTLQYVCDKLKEEREYETILELCNEAIRMYPFAEWQSVKIDCLMCLNRYKEAMAEYEATSKMFFEELGVSPSEKMMTQFRHMSSMISSSVHGIDDIKKGLNEKEYAAGAYYLSYPSFVDSYRVIRRMTERNGQSVFLMVVSLCDAKGNPIEAKDRVDVLADGLRIAIKKSLRRSDLYSLYSPTQFVILLNGTNEEDCDIISSRITHAFCETHRSWRKCLKYHVASAVELKESDKGMQFSASKVWE